jgi:hypothetical protein
MYSDTMREEIGSFRRRIAQAELERDGWRAAGHNEKYVEAYCMVEALELQLETRLQTHATRTALG